MGPEFVGPVVVEAGVVEAEVVGPGIVEVGVVGPRNVEPGVVGLPVEHGRHYHQVLLGGLGSSLFSGLVLRRLGQRANAPAGWRFSRAAARLVCFFGFGIKIFINNTKRRILKSRQIDPFYLLS